MSPWSRGTVHFGQHAGAEPTFEERVREEKREREEHRGGNINCQLQACNVLHAVLGAIGLGLAGTQFQARMGIDNYRQIDLRTASALLYTLTGTVGFYCVNRSHGSIVIKCLYIVTAFFALGTAVFYGFTTYKVISIQRLISGNKFGQPGSLLQFTSATGTSANFLPKIFVSASMSVLSLCIFILSLLSLALLDRLVVAENSRWYPALADDRIRAKFNQTLLMGAAFVKLLTAIACLCLAAFVEFEHSRLAPQQDHIRLVLDQLSAFLALGSAITDLYAVYNKTHKTLNLKVSIGVSLVAAVWCLKSVDNNTFPFYKEDINAYRIAFSASQSSFASITNPQYTIVVVHGILLAILSILALLCACTCVQAASCLRECIAKKGEGTIGGDLRRKSRALAILHSLWAILLLCLVAVGLAEVPWTGDYIGGDMLWLAVLLFCTGLLNSANKRNALATKLTLNALALSFCVEKTLLSCWLSLQSFTHPDYRNEAVFDRRSRFGQAILHCIQAIVLLTASITSLCGLFVFGGALRAMRRGSRKYGVLHCCCSISALFYAVAIIGSETFFEIDKWAWGEAVLEQSQFYRLGNGLLGITVFVFQLICFSSSQVLLPTVLLQVVLTSLALFTLNSTITNTYFLQILFNSRASIGFSSRQRLLLTIALSFAGISAIACALQTIFGTICILRCSYLLHHSSRQKGGGRGEVFFPSGGEPPSTVSYYTRSPVEREIGCGGGDDGGGGYGAIPSPFASPPSSELHQFAIRPIEEQTLYWSAEENPYIYKSTKRIFGEPILALRPYNIDYNQNNTNHSQSGMGRGEGGVGVGGVGLRRFNSQSNANFISTAASSLNNNSPTAHSPISRR